MLSCSSHVNFFPCGKYWCGRGIRFWPDWFGIPPYREMRDADGRRVYPGAPGTHTVRIRTARRNPGIVRDFRPDYGGYVSPVFELAIAAEWAATEGPGSARNFFSYTSRTWQDSLQLEHAPPPHQATRISCRGSRIPDGSPASQDTAPAPCTLALSRSPIPGTKGRRLFKYRQDLKLIMAGRIMLPAQVNHCELE